MIKYILKTLALVAILLPFMETQSRRANRLIIRNNCYNERTQDLAITYRHLQSPLPWETGIKLIEK